MWFYIYKTGKTWSSEWGAEICSGHKYFVSLCQFFNLMVCSVFLVKLRRIIIIATLDGPVYFEKFYGTCIYIYLYICFIRCLYLLFSYRRKLRLARCIYICSTQCLYFLFSYRRMLRLVLFVTFVLSFLKPVEGAAGNSLKIYRLSSSISVF